MALRTPSILLALILVPGVCLPCRADSVATTGDANVAKSTLDCDNMQRALQTANPREEAYIIYVCALVDRGVLGRRMVDSTFQWARRTPYPKRVQYFKNALITQAAKRGIRLPQNVPSTARAIQGRVVLKILVVELPVAGAVVMIEGTNLSTTSDSTGQFTFTGAPYGTYTLRASATTFLGARSGSATVALPTPPPSKQPARVEIELK